MGGVQGGGWGVLGAAYLVVPGLGQRAEWGPGLGRRVSFSVRRPESARTRLRRCS